MEYSVPEGCLQVLRRLEQAGYEAYFVGGCVRDLLRGAIPHDWDICTSARPEQVMACFDRERVLPTGLKHGTVTVLDDDTPYEITTFREEGDYSDGRRPDQVRFVNSLREDLARRDFTMNAIAMSADGEIHDPFGGTADIEAGVVRCVGEPDRRFQEDGLRVLRALRFSAVLGFEIEGETARAIHANRERLACVAAERIQEELKKLLLGPAVGRVLRGYGDVLCTFWPELGRMFHFDQRSRWHCYDLWEHTVVAVERSEPDLIVRLTLLLHDTGKVDCFTVDEAGEGHFCGHAARSAALAEELLGRLRFDRETMRQVTGLVARHDVRIDPEDKPIRRWLNRLGPEGLRRLIAVQRGDALAQNHAQTQARLSRLAELEVRRKAVLAQGQCFSRESLAVNGRDVLAAGIASGPAVGRVLDALLEQVLDGGLPNERDQLLEKMESIITLQNKLDSTDQNC